MIREPVVRGTRTDSAIKPIPFISGMTRPSALAAPVLVRMMLLKTERDFRKSVAPALGGAPIRELPGTLHGPDWWGTSRLVEAVGVPTSPEWIAEATLPHELFPCAWCREPIAVSPCPFCGDAALSATRGVTTVQNV